MFTYTNYFHQGKTNNEEIPDKTVCARSVKSEIADSREQFFVKYCSGELYDPTNIDWKYNKKPWKLKRTTEAVFRLYLAYLGYPTKTTMGRKVYKIKAEREL